MDIASFDFSKIHDYLVKRLPRLGVEIDGRFLRIVRLAPAPHGGFQVAAYGTLDVDLWLAGKIEQQRICAAIEQLGGGIRRVAVNVDHSSLRIRRMIFAKMPEKDVLEAIRWNFREHIEVPVEKYAVSYVPLRDPPDANKMSVMAYGLSDQAITDFTNLLQSVSLKPVSLEPTATALLATIYQNGLLDDDKCHSCILFGERASIFIVIKERAVVFSRPLSDISIDAFHRQVMRNNNIGLDEARETYTLWVKSVHSGAESEYKNLSLQKIQMTAGHFMSQFVVEIQRSIDAFCIMYGVDRVDFLHICGLGASFPNLADHLGKSLGVRAEALNPFSRFMDSSKQTVAVVNEAPAYAVAVGLAIP